MTLTDTGRLALAYAEEIFQVGGELEAAGSAGRRIWRDTTV